ncbi:hypothetical protein CUJ83_03250 [Methanocella sp. CWC-04]|uniref:Uncharacterized protein n=1 Tax=Methanooceanicella nereidis TaxID=2052831 RepID=A0AAP2RDH2_9EURY|nr:hypothetical protein [Methanocella sp. CWC-04]MCD1294010.1 hypothetical protein [Methanocella sp. CWC-04]
MADKGRGVKDVRKAINESAGSNRLSYVFNIVAILLILCAFNMNAICSALSMSSSPVNDTTDNASVPVSTPVPSLMVESTNSNFPSLIIAVLIVVGSAGAMVLLKGGRRKS